MISSRPSTYRSLQLFQLLHCLLTVDVYLADFPIKHPDGRYEWKRLKTNRNQTMKPVSSSLPAIKREQGSRESATYGKSYGRVGNHSPIGVILVDAGRLSPENAERILRLQVGEGTRFGDTALGLGLLTEEDIRFALSRQFDYSYLPA